MKLSQSFNIYSETTEIKDFLKKNGYILFKNILNKDLISKVNQSFDKNFEKIAIKTKTKRTLPGASHCIEEIQQLILDQNIIKVLNKIFSNQQYCYTSHSDMHEGVSVGWHKDDGKGDYFENLGNYFNSEECKVYKIAIYLRDAMEKGGLTVRQGSHKFDDYNQGESIYIPSEITDVIIFDVRITHKGDSSDSFFYRLKRKLNFNLLNYQRRSVFFSFGMDNIYTETFSKKNMERQINQTKNYNLDKMSDEFRNNLNKLNIKTYF